MAKNWAEDIAAAIDELESTDSEEETVEAKPEDDESEEAVKAEESDSEEEDIEEEVQLEAQSDEPDEQQEEGAEAEEEPAAIPDAPEHWSQADKDEYGALPDDVKPLWLEKSKSLEAGYQQKFEDVATQRKELDPYRNFHEVFKPMEREMAAAGVTPEQYTRQLVATALRIQQDPVSELRALAQNYNVSLDELAGRQEAPATDENDDYLDPDIKALKDALGQQATQISELSTKIDQSHTATRQASETQVLNEWAGFAQAIGEDGQPLHPHADDLRQLVGYELSKNPPQMGESNRDAFKRAYDAVKWTVPEIRETLMQTQQKEVEVEVTEQERAAQHQKDVEKAKKVKKPPRTKSEPVNEAPVVGETWGEELGRQWDAAEERLSS